MRQLAALPRGDHRVAFTSDKYAGSDETALRGSLLDALSKTPLCCPAEPQAQNTASAIAETIPNTLPASSTAGDKRVFAALARLPGDSLVYYEPVVRRRYPDLIAILPEVGVLVIKVKGWRLAEVSSVTPDAVTTTRRSAASVVPHPHQQARGHMLRLMDEGRRHPRAGLLMRSEGRYVGSYALPFAILGLGLLSYRLIALGGCETQRGMIALIAALPVIWLFINAEARAPAPMMPLTPAPPSLRSPIMGSLIPFTGRTELARRRQTPLTTASRQLDLVLDDARLRGMTREERSQALRSLAHLLIEACGMAMREVGDGIERRAPSGDTAPAQGRCLCPPVDAAADAGEPGEPAAAV